ncbi:unnamed protein product [Brassica oleracea]
MSKEHFSIPEAQSSTLIPVDLLISIFSLVIKILGIHNSSP